MHVRASPGESFSRKQDENGPLVQKLGPGSAQQQRLKIYSISDIRKPPVRLVEVPGTCLKQCPDIGGRPQALI